jgi:SAM-dependent methyltransferase
MSEHAHVAGHYEHGQLLDAIRDGVKAIGKTPSTVTVDDLAPVDEFHIGGRKASEEFVDQLDLAETDHTLDVGCGLGGTGRFVADRYGCRVTGIDLTPEFVETGRVLCDWVQMADRVELHQGDALEMPFQEATFDAAVMLHVGMNIPDKEGLCAQVARVLKPGGRFGIYDITRTGDRGLTYPVPWASTPDTDALATADDYREALEMAGFEITAIRNRHGFAMDFFNKTNRKMAKAGGPPPMGIHVHMGREAPAKIRHMIKNLESGCIAPVEFISRKIA